jgi:hypothetical protein
VDLKVPITITDELSDEVITATALLNLASGEIHRVEYQDYDADLQGLPWESEDYEFTSGVLSNAGKDVEFGVHVNKTTGQYSVSASELLEIKVRAAALFAGVSGKALLANVEPKPAAAALRLARVARGAPAAPTEPGSTTQRQAIRQPKPGRRHALAQSRSGSGAVRHTRQCRCVQHLDAAVVHFQHAVELQL